MWSASGGGNSSANNEPRGDGDAGGKRRLISQLLAIRGVSGQAVAKIVSLLEEEAPQRWDVRTTLSARLEGVCSTLQVPLKAGGSFDWPVALPQRLLPYLLEESRGFRTAFESAMQARPCNANRPWRFVLYCDEITPGNPLRPDNQRKLVAFYGGWIEMGDMLRLEQCWLTLGVIRTSQCKLVAGGLSFVTRLLLRALFLGPESLLSAGVVVGDRMLYSSFCRLLCDEGAGKMIWAVKGASSHRPCMQCKNVVALSDDSLVTHDASGYLVDISCTEKERFDLAGPGDVARAFDAVAAVDATPGRTRAQLERAEKAHGISFDKHCLLADHELRRVVCSTSYARDPMHIMLAGGVLNTEMFSMLRALARSKPGFSFATLRTWLSADWVQAKSRAKSNMREVFNESRETASYRDHTFKAGASELLGAYPILRHFLERFISPDELKPERAAFLACCRVVDLMQAAKRDGPRDHMPALKAAIAESFRLHLAAHGREFLRPKHHYQWHMCDQADADGFWLDCFTHERKHQVIKDCADLVRNTRTCERSVLAGVVNSSVQQLQDFDRCGFLTRHTAHAELSAVLQQPCMVARRLRFDFVQYDEGDVIFVDAAVGVIEACAYIGGEWALIFRRFKVAERRIRCTTLHPLEISLVCWAGLW